jgi:MoaA/NifB/PqqE/SkfB family radical SAM enzyme
MVAEYMSNDITCCLPWNHLATHPNGNVSLCCQAKLDDGSGFAKTQGNFLNLENRKVIEILNSDSFVNVRKKMIAGEKPETCMRCYDAESKGEWSKRVFENRRFDWNPGNLTEIVSQGNLEFLELRLGNVCNLACATCNSISSSKWVKDEIALSNKLSWYKDITHIETKRYKWFEDESFYEKLAEDNPNLKTIYINGGEPFLIKAHKRLLEKLVENNKAKNISLEYSTNVTILPIDYLQLWKNFKSITVMLSVDDLEERNDWLRWPSQWNDIEKNINWYIENKLDNLDLIMCQTVNALNIFYVDQFIEYCNKLKIKHTANFVYSPSIFSARSLNEPKKEYVLNKFKDLNLSQLKSWLEIPYDIESEKKLIEFVTELSFLRNINSEIFNFKNIY